MRATKLAMDKNFLWEASWELILDECAPFLVHFAVSGRMERETKVDTCRELKQYVYAQKGT